MFLDLARTTDFEIANPATSLAATSGDELATTDFESDIAATSRAATSGDERGN